MGCSEVSVSAQTMRGRGVVTTVAPTPGNSMIGSLHIEDTQGGPAVYDIRVDLTCSGSVERSTPNTPVRLSCVHNSGAGGSTCHMGRIEVWNRNALHVGSSGLGTWGTVRQAFSRFIRLT
eukprot:COSAG04_NODE_519_length_13169_cov_10.968248_8_plen_120_part_00